MIAAQTNFTATNFSSLANHVEHDASSRFLSGTRLTPRALWEYSQTFVNLTTGILVIDDTVLDHPYAKDIELVKWQYSGTHHSVVRGIGVISLLWSRQETCDHIPTDFRIYHPETDGRTKNQHAREYVVMDSFYASVETLHLINDYFNPQVRKS